jgi:hypothetical protein
LFGDWIGDVRGRNHEEVGFDVLQYAFMEQQPSYHVIRVFRQIWALKGGFNSLVDEFIDFGGFEVAFDEFVGDVGAFIEVLVGGEVLYALVIETVVKELGGELKWKLGVGVGEMGLGFETHVYNGFIYVRK